MADALQSAIERVYGDDAQLAASQRARYQRGLQAFCQRYGPGEVRVYHAPGRVNLIGEHTDYNHGYVLPMALDRDVLLYARPRDDSRMNLANIEPGFGERIFDIGPEIGRQAIGDWVNYAQGPAQLLAQEYGPTLRGMEALVDGEMPHGIPRGAGLSSSSALTVVSAVALVEINHLPLAGAALADACGRAEWYVGTRGGIMDQFISILAQRDHALFLDCRPKADGSYAFQQVPIPAGYSVVVVDSGVRHRNTGPLFNRRVAACRIGVRLLQQRFPGITHLRDVQQVPWEELEPLLPEVLHRDNLAARGIDAETILDSGVKADTDTFMVRRRCRHVWSENQRVLTTVEALRQGDMATVCQQMAAAHASARDDYEISVPEVEQLIGLATGVSGRIGARLTGAGWGGCIVVMTPRELVPSLQAAIDSRYAQATGLRSGIFECLSAAGAGLVYQTTL
jgi:galactokinase